ncbi:hypothetical protein MLD38_038335 [Melastoma candidum]|uniref:Uncharacterized protein n=1 Tax=Melastoma candidum TaxID=119954 RepID=A0ACB9KZL1_9MYRT|nr:hypothetical protein MLD38_038335 [Melastoma candidum]
MKGGVGGGSGGVGGKRRWRCLVVGVLVLVVCSMLVPLAFLLGRFNTSSAAVFVSDQLNSATIAFRIYDKYESGARKSQPNPEKVQSDHVNDIIKKLAPNISKDVSKDIDSGSKKQAHTMMEDHSRPQVTGFPPPASVTKPGSWKSASGIDFGEELPGSRGLLVDAGKQCEVRFGSYCLWLQEHREQMKDSTVKRMKDLLFVARAYFPSIAKLSSQEKLSREMKQNIQDFERVLSESSKDSDLPPQIGGKLERMQASIAKAKSFPVDCNNVYKKLSQILDMTEDEANFHMKQSAFIYRIAVQTMPKSLHCISLRLTVDYFTSSTNDIESPLAEKYSDPDLHHVVIFSKNVLASSVVINSTVMNAKESGKIVFHVLTDKKNYFAMKLWFFRNKYKNSAVQVLNAEELGNRDEATPLPFSLPDEFRISFTGVNNFSFLTSRTEYISTFSRSHYLLPDAFPNLKKVVVLDDDVVVQRDLSALWGVSMGGKVNGAVQVCSVNLGMLRSLGQEVLDKNSCAWMSGLNLIDLQRWRELKLSQAYQRFTRQLEARSQMREAISLYATLLSFQKLIYPLDSSWVLSGLGQNYGLSAQATGKAAVLHYNGDMKPWLDLGIPKYKDYWRKYLNKDDQILSDCNMSP